MVVELLSMLPRFKKHNLFGQRTIFIPIYRIINDLMTGKEGNILEKFRAPELFIDKDGQWYTDGVLMINKEILKLFASHLKRDGKDEYYIDWKNQLCSVTVEDAPFFVQSVTEEAGRLMIQLYDGRKFPLPPGNIILINNIPYISLFWQRDTKLSRPSYSELFKNLMEKDGHYLIEYGDSEWLVEEVNNSLGE